MTWARREDLHELMDEPGLDPAEHRRALRFLRWMNRWSLARWMIGREVRRVLFEAGGGDSGRTAGRGPRVLDIATGGGDIPQYLLDRRIAGWAVGVDRSAEALHLAREMSPGVVYVRADALRLPFADGAFDAATCHLFCHHLSMVECGALFAEMNRVAGSWVVMDLERSRWLYWFLKVATLFCGSRLARWDGPVSVRRAYRRGEIGRILSAGGMARAVLGPVLGRWLLRG